MTAATDCLFCNIVAGAIPADLVFENDEVLAFSDIAPQAPTHVLVIPKLHIENAGTIEGDHRDVVASLMLATQQVAQIEGIDGEDRGYRLIMNVGPDAANSVPHLHIHVLGGRSLTWPPG